MASGAEDIPVSCRNCGCCPTCGKPNNLPYYGLPYIQYPYVPIPTAQPIWIYTPPQWINPQYPWGDSNIYTTGTITVNT